MPVKTLAESHGVTLEEANRIYQLQGELSTLQRFLDEHPISGFDGVLISYDPCYHIEIRLLEGSDLDQSRTRIAGDEELQNLAPYVRLRTVAIGQAQLLEAQSQIDVLGDLYTTSDIDVTRDKVLIGLASGVRPDEARRILEEAYQNGEIVLPPSAFEFEQWEDVPL